MNGTTSKAVNDEFPNRGAVRPAGISLAPPVSVLPA
jgi:hypothetical protein